MLYIRNAGDAKDALTQDQHSAFIKKCELYIEKLKAAGKLIAAQPLVREGFTLPKTASGWTTLAIDPTREVHAGYYHIRATDIGEAIAIVKENPEFEFVPSARIEIRLIKMKEEETWFIYPAGDRK